MVKKLEEMNGMALKLYKPRLEDLWFRRELLADETTMSYNHAYGGTIAFPRERWREWYDRWLVDREGRRFYRYLMKNDGAFVGEVAYHWDAEREICLSDVIVRGDLRGKGYGREGLRLLCEAAMENGVTVLYDEIAVDNPSVKLFLRCGFVEVKRTEETVLVKKI